MTQSAYGPVLEHPVAKRLLTVQAISEAGDFVGLSALLVLSYTRTGSVLGPAGVYAARTLPSLAVGTVFSGWLDRPPRRAALVTLAGDRIQTATIVVGGATGNPTRCSTAEARLAGQSASDAAIAAASSAVAESLSDPLGDVYASGEFRVHLAGVMARDALNLALQRARG